MSQDPDTQAPVFDLSGGALCLDFINTLGNRAGPEPLEERLDEYDDLVAFARQAGAIGEPTAAALVAAGRAQPEEAGRTLGRAIALREALHGIFDALAAGDRPGQDALSGLNAVLGPALAHARLAATERGYALEWEEAGNGGADAIPLDRPLWPVARSAMELLLEADLARVGECESDTCGFLFLDTTRNRSRRWCDTRICGNRARVRRHRRRLAEVE